MMPLWFDSLLMLCCYFQIFFLVMQNIFYPAERIEDRFDVKGCTAGRYQEVSADWLIPVSFKWNLTPPALWGPPVSVFGLPFPIMGRSCHKSHFCRDKNFVMTNTCLLWQTHVCHDKTCLLLQQKYASCNKTFVTTKYFCCDKYLSWQTCVCCDKSFVVTGIFLSWQKMCFVMTNICLLRQK